MEKKFYTDDFEQFLKETTDDFRMYPSKRVWNSLYNNLHPGRKWPSLAVCLLLVSSVIFIGLSHKNEITGSGNIVTKDAGNNPFSVSQNNNTASVTLFQKETSLQNNLSVDLTTATSTGPTPVSEINNRPKNEGGFNAPQTPLTVANINRPPGNTHHGTANNQAQSNGIRNKFNRSVNSSSAMQFTHVVAEADAAGNDERIGNRRVEIINIAPGHVKGFHQLTLVDKTLPVVKLPLLATAGNNKIRIEKEWIEDYAFHNQPKPSLKSRLQYQLYLTPSVGFRTLTQKTRYSAPARPSVVTSVPDGPPALQQNAAFNLETGYSLLYAQSKSMHLKGGVQFNFTNYKIHAHQLGHSTNANVVLNDSYSANGIILSPRSTSLANLRGKSNDKKLNSSTFQVSLPLGTDIKFAGRHNLQWFIGATVQPTYVLFGNAYIVSADSRNYVYDSKFLRKWNLNAGVEAFVSYRTKKGITLNAGPQFRYQFFSTYDNKYSYDEKLYNVGVKLGITRNF